jgi:hypothetical protein
LCDVHERKGQWPSMPHISTFSFCPIASRMPSCCYLLRFACRVLIYLTFFGRLNRGTASKEAEPVARNIRSILLSLSLSCIQAFYESVRLIHVVSDAEASPRSSFNCSAPQRLFKRLVTVLSESRHLTANNADDADVRRGLTRIFNGE